MSCRSGGSCYGIIGQLLLCKRLILPTKCLMQAVPQVQPVPVPVPAVVLALCGQGLTCRLPLARLAVLAALLELGFDGWHILLAHL